LHFLQFVNSIDLIDAIYYYNALFVFIDAIYYYNALFASIDSIDLIDAI